jgi:endogenous inhibitor of DNA gyrase (YacG/DUF329 family)
MTKRIITWETTCLNCGKPFLTPRTRQKFCSHRCQRANVAKVAQSRVKTYNSHLLAAESRKVPLTSLQKEVLYGTLLGDGCLTATRKGENKFLLRFTHCEKQYAYLRYKIKILAPLFQGKIHVSPAKDHYINGHLAKSTKSYRAHSIYHGNLGRMNSLFYRENKGKRTKIIHETVLERLTATSLLFWYLDDGTFDKGTGAVELFTNNFTFKEVTKLVEILRRKFGVESKIRTTSAHQYTIRISQKGVVAFIAKLRSSPFYRDIPKCMRYKL